MTRRSRTRCDSPSESCVCSSSAYRLFLLAAAQSTDAFLNETLRTVCGSLALAQYRMYAAAALQSFTPALNGCVACCRMRSFLGEWLWQEDGVPDYTQSKPVAPRLADLVCVDNLMGFKTR